MKKLLAAIVLFCTLAVAFSSCASEKDWAYIENKKELIVGITYFEPMNYLDETGNLVGFETEFTQAVCEILGVTPKFQEISWSAKVNELNAKNIDCVWNGMTINDTLSETTSISTPYMENKQVLIAKAENADALKDSVAGKNIVAEKESAGEATVTGEDFFKEANYTAVDTQAKALMEVAAGTADGCVVDYIYSKAVIGEGTDYAGLVVVEGVNFAKEQYGIAFRKGDTELTTKVNDAITTLVGNGKLMEIAEKYNLSDMIIAK